MNWNIIMTNTRMNQLLIIRIHKNIFLFYCYGSFSIHRYSSDHFSFSIMKKFTHKIILEYHS